MFFLSCIVVRGCNDGGIHTEAYVWNVVGITCAVITGRTWLSSGLSVFGTPSRPPSTRRPSRSPPAQSTCAGSDCAALHSAHACGFGHAQGEENWFSTLLRLFMFTGTWKNKSDNKYTYTRHRPHPHPHLILTLHPQTITVCVFITGQICGIW